MKPFPRRGFTLVEVLVAITVMSLIAMFTWQTIASTTDVRITLEDEHEKRRALDSAIGRLEREISLAFLNK